MEESQPEYRSYMLRMWWARKNEAMVLRIFVEDPRTGECQAFTDLKTFTAFLREEIGFDEHALPD